MMQSILSLIHESLTSTTTSSRSSEHASSSEAPKSGTRGEFESILTREDPQSMRCTSETRIKARATSNDAADDDESDEDDATTCVNVDDFAAWAITHTIAAPPPSPSMMAMAKNPSVQMGAVKLPSQTNMQAANSDFRHLRDVSTTYASPAPMPLPAMNRAGETIPAAALAPKTQEMAAVKDDAPLSSAITREMTIPTAAPKTQEMAAAQTQSFIEKMARSKSATDIPPPSAIPMVSGAPPANSQAPKADLAIPTHQAPTFSMANGAANNGASNNDANTGNGNPPKSRTTKAWDSSKDDDTFLSAASTRFPGSMPILSDAAFHPTVAVTATDPRILTAMPTRMIAKLDMREASDARQAAADRAVNQLTLSRAADGEIDVPELGRIRVDATTRNGEVDVRITADRAETQSLVAGHTHEIVIDARSAAIPIVDLTVKLDPRAEPQTNFASSQDSSSRRDPRRDADETSEKQANSSRTSARARFVL